MKIKIDATRDSNLIAIWIDSACYSVWRKNKSEYLYRFLNPDEYEFVCLEDVKHFIIWQYIFK